MTGHIDYTKTLDGLSVTFSHTVTSQFNKTDHLLLAYIYPYTYNDMLYSIKEVEYKCNQNE